MNHVFAVLFAFGFGNLAMLGWLAAASAPLLIHLWNRRKYQETEWAAIEFLLAAARRNARRLQLRQWVLLAVRTAIVVLVVTALAEPFFDQLGMRFMPGGRTHKLLVVDGSYSMDYRPTDRSRFEQAKQLAVQIVEASGPSDAFTLVMMGSPAQVIVGTPALETGSFVKEIESLRLTHAAADLSSTLALVRKMVERVTAKHRRLEHHEVYFLTDLGRNTWAPATQDDPAGVELQRQIDQLSAQARLIVFDLGQPEPENLAVVHLKRNEPFTIAGHQATFDVNLRNFGTRPRLRQVVQWAVDDRPVGETLVDLPPGGEASVSFGHRFETPGQHVVSVQLSPDLLEVDNRRWLSVPVKSQLRTLCVGSQPQATKYLDLALNPTGSRQSPVHNQTVPESALSELDLGQFDSVFLANVGQFTKTEARLLVRYLRQGGGLVFFLGDQVIPSRYNALLASERRPGERVLPARLGPIVQEAQYRFDALDYRHPLVRVFRGQEQAGLLTTPVYRYFQLTIPAAWPEAQVALAFADGRPAIVEESLHGGRTVLVATAASLASVDPVTGNPWTTMPAWPSFVPIVQELLALAVGNQIEQSNGLVGQTLSAPVPAAQRGAALNLRSPDGQDHPVTVLTDSDPPRWTFAKTVESGLYQLGLRSSAESASATISYAVNVATVESDLAKVDSQHLPEDLLVETEWRGLNADPVGQISRRAGVHRMLLYGALGLLLLETCLAWRLGRSLA